MQGGKLKDRKRKRVYKVKVTTGSLVICLEIIDIFKS